MATVGSFSLIENRQNKLTFFDQYHNLIARKNQEKLRTPWLEQDMFSSPTLENQISKEIVERSNFFENEKIFVSFLTINVDDMSEKFGEKTKSLQTKLSQKAMSYIASRNTHDSWLLIPSLSFLAKQPFFVVFSPYIYIYIGGDEELAEKIWNKLGLGLFPKTIFQDF